MAIRQHSNKPSAKYNFIFERTSVVRNRDIQILDEVDIGGGKSKIAAKVLLQESNIKNKNGRFYTQQICESIVNQLTPKAHSRSLLMEID